MPKLLGLRLLLLFHGFTQAAWWMVRVVTRLHFPFVGKFLGLGA
jgi:hypothetical protein